MKLLTREEAINKVGIDAVDAVEKLNCEPTNRLYEHEDGEIEWSSSVSLSANLTIYYYTDAFDELDVEEHGGDWGILDWEERIGGYEIY